MYVGESERAVRQCFERARASSPCVIFFDELDSLCPRRSGAEVFYLVKTVIVQCWSFAWIFHSFVQTNSTARVVNQMLTEMDGLETRKQVYVMAATNRPDIIDPAVMRWVMLRCDGVMWKYQICSIMIHIYRDLKCEDCGSFCRGC